MEKYLDLKNGDNESFINLKKQYKTNKYCNLDQGIAIITFSLFSSIFFFYKSISLHLISKLHSLTFGIISAFFTIYSEIYVVFRDYNRGEFPHWADSLGIPIFRSILLGLFLFPWIFVNYYISTIKSWNLALFDLTLRYKKKKFWFNFLSCITFLLTIIYIIDGSFLHVISTFIWILFYQSLILRLQKMANKTAT
ncbi:hypothetical protein [Leptospira meyeri]|nr:hypothetical protein [Leptospira meyeri]